jgi:hypothetical protein
MPYSVDLAVFVSSDVKKAGHDSLAPAF